MDFFGFLKVCRQIIIVVIVGIVLTRSNLHSGYIPYKQSEKINTYQTLGSFKAFSHGYQRLNNNRYSFNIHGTCLNIFISGGLLNATNFSLSK